MNYINDLIKYVANNIETINIPDHKLHLRYNKSPSTLRRHFSKVKPVTLRVYIIKLKIQEAVKTKEVNPSVKNRELMDRLNYFYTEKAFRNHLKEYGNSEGEQNLSNCSSFNLNFILNKRVLDEIFLRIVLLFNLAEIEKFTSGVKRVDFDVNNTIFQIIEFIIPIDQRHIYTIYLDVDEISLSFDLMVEDPLGRVIIPNSINGYIKCLSNIENVFTPKIDFSITHSLKNWDFIYRELFQSKRGFPFDEKNNNEISLEINEDSKFVKESTLLLDEIKLKMLNEYIKDFNQKFDYDFSQMNLLLKSIRLKKLAEVKKHLSLMPFDDFHSVDLIIKMVDSPYISEIEIENYSPVLSQETFDKIRILPQKQIIESIISFKNHVETIKDNDDFDYDTNQIIVNIILSVN